MFLNKYKFKLSITAYFMLLLYTFYLTNLYFDSTRGPDYELYSNYLNYFFSGTNFTGLDQGIFYYFSVSFVFWFV